MSGYSRLILPANRHIFHRQYHHLYPREVQPALQRQRGLVVKLEQPGEEVFLVHDQLAREEDRVGEFLADSFAQGVELFDGVGAESEIGLGRETVAGRSSRRN